MNFLIILLCIILIAVIIVQIGKVSELASSIRGEEAAERDSNNWSARLLLAFLPIFLIGCIASAIYYYPYMLGYGPHESASVHGLELDHLFNITLVVTGIVFILTHIALFWFSYKYAAKEGQKAAFISHDNTLEIVWTVVPAITMAYLVINGLIVWNNTMADVDPGEDIVEVEAVASQFLWELRHPGKDKVLGARDYKLINALNPLGQDWRDEKNIDDFIMDTLFLPVDKKVRVRITAKDVLHNFYLPHFRVKMDAVPGIPTYFVFTPDKTTEEYRQGLKEYGGMWLEPADPEEPDGPRRWETFEYELACAELCGRGHYSMHKFVRVVPQEEYEAWLNRVEQTSYYLNNVRGKKNDPHKGKQLDIEKRFYEIEAAAAEEVAAPPVTQEPTTQEATAVEVVKDSVVVIENAH